MTGNVLYSAIITLAQRGIFERDREDELVSRMLDRLAIPDTKVMCYPDRHQGGLGARHQLTARFRADGRV